MAPAACALGLALAGCLSPAAVEPAGLASALEPLTEPLLGFGAFHSLKVPSFDGVPIHVDVQLPGGDGPFPVLVSFTPYSRASSNLWGGFNSTGLQLDALRLRLAEYYVPRGYAVAVAHVRGTGESGGCLTVGGPEEGRDGYAVVEALAAQPWSSGRIGMYGGSYVGTTPLETAVLAPPHLAAVVSVAPVTEWYRYYFERGEPRVNGEQPFRGSSFTDPFDWLVEGATPGPRTGASGAPDELRCWADFTLNYYGQDDYNAYWRERDIRRDAGHITTPVLYAQGFLDENVATSMIPGFWSSLPSEKRAWFGQHGHGVPAKREDWHLYVHRWLDSWLLGRDNGALLLPGVLVEDNRALWRAEATWPPRDTLPQRFWLTAEGGLARGAPGEGSLGYRDEGTGSEDARLEGVNHLRFVSEPLEAPLHLAGEPSVRLLASSSERDTQFAVHVYDRSPDGTEAFVTRGYQDGRHRDSLERGEDLVPGQRYAFDFPLHPRDHHVAEGHRLVVVVKSSDDYVVRDAMRAMNDMFFGHEGSWLELPVIDPATRSFAEEAPLPPAWG